MDDRQNSEAAPADASAAEADASWASARSYWVRMRNVFGILALGALATLGAGLQQVATGQASARAANVPVAFGPPASVTPGAGRVAAAVVPFAEGRPASNAPAITLATSTAPEGRGFVESDDGLAVQSAPGPAVPNTLADPLLVVPALPARPPGSRPMIAVMIDDVGLNSRTDRDSVNLPSPMTIAFLPYGRNLQQLADAAKARGHEVMLHMPMQGRGTANPGPHALRPGMSAAEIEANFSWGLAQFSGYTGVNNHMGSQFTQDAAGMAVVMREVARRKLQFVDSRTTSQSAARSAAAALNVPFAERDVFLDNHIDGSYVLVQLAEVEARARQNGSAIAIGHPHAATLVAVAAWARTLDAKGIDLVTISTLIAHRKTPLWRLAADRAAPKSGG